MTLKVQRRIGSQTNVVVNSEMTGDAAWLIEELSTLLCDPLMVRFTLEREVRMVTPDAQVTT